MKKMARRDCLGMLGSPVESFKRRRALPVCSFNMEVVHYFDRLLTVRKDLNEFVFITKKEAASRS